MAHDHLRIGHGKRVVVDCHGSIPAGGHVASKPWYVDGYNKPVTDWLLAHDFTIIVPCLRDPYDGAGQAEAVIDRLGLDRPMLTAQCIGGLTGYAMLARRPDAYRGAAFLNPVSSGLLMPRDYNRQKLAHIHFERITAPISVWHGLDDMLVTPQQTLRLDELIPHMTVYWMQGQRHDSTPEAYRDGLAEFVDTLDWAA